MQDQLVVENELSIIEHLIDIERYEEAEKHIENILRADPHHPIALYHLAVVKSSYSRYSEARNLCQQALKYGFDQESSFHFIGTSYQREDNYIEAEKAYLKALEVNPESGTVHAAYGYLMLLAHENEKALTLFEVAIRLEPENPWVNQMALEYFYATSDKKQQLVYIRTIMEKGDSDIRKMLNIAVFHQLNGDYKNAREYYRQAYLLNPMDQDMLSILKEFEVISHPLFFYKRHIPKYIGTLLMLFCFVGIHLSYWIFDHPVINTLYVFYNLIVIYIIMAPFFYKWLTERKN